MGREAVLSGVAEIEVKHPTDSLVFHHVGADILGDGMLEFGPHNYVRVEFIRHTVDVGHHISLV